MASQGSAGTAKWVYAFGDGKAEGKSQMRELLGGKGRTSPRCPISASRASRLHHHHGGLHILLRA